MPDGPEISVVVPTYQRRAQVTAALDELLAQEVGVPFEVVVVDDGSTDGTAGALRDRARGEPRVRPVVLANNQGSGTARNRGWRAARAPLVAFTDDDCSPEPGWLASLHAAFGDGADVVTGRTIVDPEQWSRAGPFSHWLTIETPTPWFETCNIAYRRDLLASLGGFDESLTARNGINFGDDTDLGRRALRAGADVRYQPDAVVRHAVTESDWAAWLRARGRRAGVAEVARRHPGLRAHFPRPWLYRRRHPLALLAAAGLALAGTSALPAALRTMVGGLAAAPWVRHRIGGEGRLPGTGPAALPGLLVGDLVETGVVAVASLRSRVWIV